MRKLAACLAVIAIAGCADLSVPTLRPVTQVLVSPDTAILRIGDTLRIKAAPLDSTATLEPQVNLAWTSSSATVASVNDSGLVKALAAGTTTVSAAVGGIQGKITVIVSGQPATLTISAGNHETASVNTAVPIPPTVLVTDANANPVPHDTVTFAVTAGGGTLAPPVPVVTGLDGKASIAWTLGPSKGANTMTATTAGTGVTGNPATFTAVATVGAPSAAQSTISASPPSIPPSNGTVFSTITITVKDSTGATISGQTVTIASTGSGNTIAQPTDTTDAQGRATAALSSSVAESKIITATVNGSVVLTHTDTVIVSNAGPSQIGVSTAVGGAVSNHAFITQPAVDIRDGFGNRVSTATNQVSVSLISGNGTLVGTTTVAAVQGRATFSGLLIKGTRAATDTLGTGQQILQFSSPGFSSVTDTVQVGVSFGYNIVDIFQRNCNSCHGFNYGNTVNAATSFSCTGNTRVVASDTSSSYIYTKIKTASPPCGSVMPTSGQMSATQVKLIRDWILQGAPNN